MPVVASSPVSWLAFQELMRRLDYEFFKQEPGRSAVTFRQINAEHLDTLPTYVTVMHPDKVDQAGNPAYETEYVIDLLNVLLDGEGNAPIEMILHAKRQFNG